MVKASNWLTHLDYERPSRVWAHWVRELSRGVRSSATTRAAAGLPIASEEQKRWYDNLQQASSSGETAALLGVAQPDRRQRHGAPHHTAGARRGRPP
jgi:hypothetical protein